MIINDFKGRYPRYEILARDLRTDEVYNAVPESAIAAIKSEFQVDEENALSLLELNYSQDKEELICQGKNVAFWIEEVL